MGEDFDIQCFPAGTALSMWINPSPNFCFARLTEDELVSVGR